MNQLERFLSEKCEPHDGSLVLLNKFIRAFYKFSDPFDPATPFDWPPPKIKRFLEQRFPVGMWHAQTAIGNLASAVHCVKVSDRPLAHFMGMLCPRDIRECEFQFYSRMAESDNRVKGRKPKALELIQTSAG